MINRAQKGFTLIELLVVIAIIGLLASVVLAAVGTARTKGVDAAVKSELSNMRSQAELYASNHGNAYTGVCTDTAANNGLSSMISSAASSTGSTVLAANAAQTLTTQVACDAASGTWVVQAPLSNAATNGFWCVDSSGASKAEVAANLLPINATSCN